MNLVKNIIYTILSIQEKALRYKLSRTLGVKNTSKRKRVFASGCLLDLNSLAEAEKEQFEAELIQILKTYSFQSEKVLEYIQKQGTNVYFVEKASKFLNPIGENEGFIYPAIGAKALYLSISILQKPRFKTKEMFVLSKGVINKYYFIYHFYNWFAFKKGFAGMDSVSQELLKKFLFEEVDVNNLQLSDIYKLKDAIKQDKNSIEFVIKICREYEGTKQVLDKISKNGSAEL